MSCTSMPSCAARSQSGRMMTCGWPISIPGLGSGPCPGQCPQDLEKGRLRNVGQNLHVRADDVDVDGPRPHDVAAENGHLQGEGNRARHVTHEALQGGRHVGQVGAALRAREQEHAIAKRREEEVFQRRRLDAAFLVIGHGSIQHRLHPLLQLLPDGRDLGHAVALRRDQHADDGLPIAFRQVFRLGHEHQDARHREGQDRRRDDDAPDDAAHQPGET